MRLGDWETLPVQQQNRSLAARIGFLAVLREVDAEAFYAGVGAEARRKRDRPEDDERDRAAVDDGRDERNRLNADLPHVAEQRAGGGDAAPGLLREHAGEQRADHAADAVRGDDVER